ncbi:hypothetical protein D3C73_1117230 [compost metagenome]
MSGAPVIFSASTLLLVHTSMRASSACISGMSGESTSGPGSNTTLTAPGNAKTQSTSACALPACSRL